MAASSGVWFAFVEFSVFFLTLAICILLKLDSRQGKPYMDEIFHVPQVQHYCKGEFLEWDPMITTLPGLYIISVAILHPLSWLLDYPISTLCSTFSLRFMNIAFATGNCILFFMLVRKLSLSRSCDGYRCLVISAALSFFPVLYFFTFLYYTDSGSTFWVLLMYYLSLHGDHKMAALAGAIAVLFRQTNVVWVVFVGGTSAERHIIEWIQPEKKDLAPEKVQELGFILLVLKRVMISLRHDIRQLARFVMTCLADVWPYLIVILSFVFFVLINGSIVVGAKDDHQVSLHFPQLFYFLAFTSGFLFMHQVTPTKIINFFKFLYKRPLIALTFIAVSYFLIWKFTTAHRYLLADNRHYTFYVWAKLFRRHELVKYGLIPLYLYAGWALLDSLYHKSAVWKLIFAVCVFVNLVPQVLLEFRYFIIPFIILRLNMKPAGSLALVLELLLYTAVNAATLYLFLEKPFKWENEDGQQRFMW